MKSIRRNILPTNTLFCRTSDSFLLESQAEEADEDEKIDDGGEEREEENKDDVVVDERTKADEGTRERRKR